MILSNMHASFAKFHFQSVLCISSTLPPNVDAGTHLPIALKTWRNYKMDGHFRNIFQSLPCENECGLINQTDSKTNDLLKNYALHLLLKGLL